MKAASQEQLTQLFEKMAALVPAGADLEGARPTSFAVEDVGTLRVGPTVGAPDFTLRLEGSGVRSRVFKIGGSENSVHHGIVYPARGIAGFPMSKAQARNLLRRL